MSFTVRGSIDLSRLAGQSRAGAAAGLRAAAEHILQVASTHVPNEEGTLERSGRATVDDGAGRAAVSYDTVYAVPQHERLDYRHSGGRSAKYLERALTGEAHTAAELVAAAMRRALR